MVAASNACRVRAKFRVRSVEMIDTGSADAIHAVVALGAVTGPGNESWSRYTPAGDIRLTVTTAAALEAFALGGTFFVDFSPAGE